jgi:cyclopropane fatty-acyl-phospholipid synthase-like methyltransferase
MKEVIFMDFRKVFNSIPEEFDKWRTRYCDEVFNDIIQYSKLDHEKTTLEIGPGTGQATEPILKTGCNYLAIELGEKLAEYTKNKFSCYENFHIVTADFESYDFGHDQFDLVYSAATIQWIPEEIAFPKVYHMLKSHGTFAMMFTKTDEKSANELLYMKMQEVYDKYFHPETDYTCHIEYNNTEKYGFTDIECRSYNKTRELNADEYVAWISTHAPHITLKEPYKSSFYKGIRDVILNFGNKITLKDTIVLYLARKP